MIDAIFHFPTDGTPKDCVQIKSGHINHTYLITTDTGVRYILQWINQFVFPHVDKLMHNMSAISEYLRAQGEGSSAMIRYIDTLDGQSYYNDGQGGAWRIYRFVDNSICLQHPETTEDFCECGRAFGAFQYALRDFPVGQLEETIVDFHNTVDRYRQLREAVRENRASRLDEVGEEIAFLLEREERACQLHRMREAGLLPLRATHTDTKINNVLFHDVTRKAICVIDLDTVMPGLSAFDFGDAIRFGASTAAEDEPDLRKVRLDLELYRAFAHGFCEQCPSLTEEELRALPLGAFTMCLECGMRFLTDYLNGDVYFAVDRPKQNLDRARTQFKLVQEIERCWDSLTSIIREETGV